MRSRWKQDFFHNDHPVIVELGCGKGEYTIGLAERYPDMNFIGVDMKGARLWRGCKTVEEKLMKNVAFIRSRIDHVEKFFGPGEVSEIWITFPDPQTGKERKRLTSPVFLDRYRQILQPDGIIHLKTDNQGFYNYTLEIISKYKHKLVFSTGDLYAMQQLDEAGTIKTYYENIWLEMGKKICYLKFRLNNGNPVAE